MTEWLNANPGAIFGIALIAAAYLILIVTAGRR